MQEHQLIQESMAESGWLWRRAQKYQAIRDGDLDRAQAPDAEGERARQDGFDADPGARVGGFGNDVVDGGAGALCRVGGDLPKPLKRID
jgi:hypothetical protein